MCPVCGRTSAAAGACPDDGQVFVTAMADTLLGTVVDQRFLIKSVLGIGGWSRVYLAHHKRLDVPVVLKVLHTHLVSDQDKLKRFQREAEISSRMRHNNIARVMDFGVMNEGQPYLVMEYLDGDTLNTLLEQKGPLPWQQVAQIISQSAEAFAYAHDHGVIHRDIKPSNLLLTKEGTIKVLDFGLAKASLLHSGRGSSLTKTGQTMGTPEYMSPEQCLGQALTPASDIYSLGLVAYELLTCTKAVTGSTTYELMKQHVDKPPPPFKQGSAVPSSIQDAVLKSLYKHPQKRYESMRDMKAAFEACSQQSSPSTTRPGAGKSVAVPVIAMVVVGMVVCAGLGWMAYQNGQSRATPQAVPALASGGQQAQFNQEIAALERTRKELTRFDFELEKRLADRYIKAGRTKDAMQVVDNILANRPGDDSMTAILSDNHWGTDPDKAIASLSANVRAYPDLHHLRAECFLLLGDLYSEKGESSKALQYYDTVRNFSGVSLDPYRAAAEERLNTLSKLNLH